MNVAIIPARGGSVRIPRKNIRDFHGKPIIAYSIATAKKSGLFERVVVSTEDEEIADVAHNHGADVILRPRHLADDPLVGTQEVVAHAMHSIPCEYACCIYATAPLLCVADLVGGFEILTRVDGLRYVYVDGMYYWGRSLEFAARPQITQDDCMKVKPWAPWIDIDTWEDWHRAAGTYAALYPQEIAA